MKTKEYVLELADLDAKLFVLVKIDRKTIVHFCINLAIKNDEKMNDVYRVDTCHGYLHEQKFWISPKPIKINLDYNYAFRNKLKEVTENAERWIKLYKNKK
jgi:hypothetical protein